MDKKVLNKTAIKFIYTVAILLVSSVVFLISFGALESTVDTATQGELITCDSRATDC